MDTLLIDVSSPPTIAIPGTRTFMFLEQYKVGWYSARSIRALQGFSSMADDYADLYSAVSAYSADSAAFTADSSASTGSPEADELAAAAGTDAATGDSSEDALLLDHLRLSVSAPSAGNDDDAAATAHLLRHCPPGSATIPTGGDPAKAAEAGTTGAAPDSNDTFNSKTRRPSSNIDVSIDEDASGSSCSSSGSDVGDDLNDIHDAQIDRTLAQDLLLSRSAASSSTGLASSTDTEPADDASDPADTQTMDNGQIGSLNAVRSATGGSDANGFTAPNLPLHALGSAPPAASGTSSLPVSFRRLRTASTGTPSPNTASQPRSRDSAPRIPPPPFTFPLGFFPHDKVELSLFNQRIGNLVVLLDESGDPNGFAAHVADLLRREGRCRAAVILRGGMRAFAARYPTLLNSHPPPYVSDALDTDLLHTMAGLSPYDPVGDLRTRQNQLVQAVWMDGTDPVDVPNLIVSDFLFLSSCLAATKDLLKANDITHVIRLGWGFKTHCSAADGVMYHDFRIEDSPNVPIRLLFEETTSIIETARLNGEKVLVHCHAGVSRSSTIILAYMIKYLHMTLHDAWNATYKIRPIIRPNPGFARALQEYEMEHFETTEPTMSIFWMSDSYLYYIEYVDFMYRVANLGSYFGPTAAWPVSGGDTGKDGYTTKSDSANARSTYMAVEE
ncbi:hypothetical protein BC831DRAFT_468572 [Entophlyctis helioformis]|nr:hypothetical protein BC831DRAFT_468572 [Entophlyctis helioformis]